MKKFRRNIFIGFAIAILSSACNLDLEPLDEISDSKAFQTIEDLEKGMTGVMVVYGGHGVVGQADRASDDLRYSLSNTGQGVQVHNWTYNAATDDLSGTWVGNAQLINRANRIFDLSLQFDQNDETVKRVQSECQFTRAYAHFEILRLYAPNYSPEAIGIPYNYTADIIYPTRLTQEEVYNNVLSDIEASLPGLNNFSEDGYWISKSAAYALKARVAQYMGNWDMAIEAANKSIELGGLRLAEIHEFASVWEDENAEGVEVIFSLRRENATLGEYYTRGSNGDVYFHPSFDLMNMYEADDVRFSSYFGKNEDGLDVVLKHDGRTEGKTNVVDLKVFRVSELFLIKAEAYVNKQMYAEAQEELETLRAKRIINPDALDMSNHTLAMKAVQDERRRELAYEGHRFYDLRRWGLGIERSDEDSPGNTQKTLPAKDYRFVFPIPQDEIFANENMKQNEGYSN